MLNDGLLEGPCEGPLDKVGWAVIVGLPVGPLEGSAVGLALKLGDDVGTVLGDLEKTLSNR